MPTQKAVSLAFSISFVVASFSASAATEAAGPVAGETADAAVQRAWRLRDARQFQDALDRVEDGLAQHPRDPQLYRLRALLLSDLGASHRAWALYRARPEVFEPAEARLFEQNHVARLINWGALYAESEQTRAQELALAEEALAALRERARTDNAPDLRTRFDEIALLTRLERHAEAVERYRALQAEGVELPPYALARVAESLLAERHPAEAAALFERIGSELPEEWDARLQQAYAYSEHEDFAAAYHHLEALKAAEPTWLRVPGAREDHPNPRHFDADLNLALMHLYGQDSAGAQQRLEALAGIGPYNASLQTALGQTYGARGWSQRALERFRMASTMEPNHVGARIGQVGALQDLGRTDLARPIHDRLLVTDPRHVQVRQMAREWDSHVGWQWQVQAAGGRSDGSDASASPLGNRDGSYRVAVQSPLLRDRWRLTAETGDAWAEFLGDRVHDRRTGVGLAYAFDRLTVSAGVDRAGDDWTDRGTGWYVDAGWRLGDTWGITAGWRHLTPEASLQARRSGITADAAALGLSWTPSDYGRVDAGLQQLRYDDGNRREALSLDAERRLLTRPHLLVEGLFAGYASRGSRDDAPYFNPESDRSLQLGVRLDHIAWREYDHHFRHRLTAMAGPYWQEGYGSAWVPQLRYEHEWRLGTGRLLQYGVNWSRPVYDGVREERLGFDLEFRWGE